MTCLWGEHKERAVGKAEKDSVSIMVIGHLKQVGR